MFRVAQEIANTDSSVTENEAENIFFIGGTMYVTYNLLSADSNGETGGIIYKLENAKYEK